MSRKHNSIGTQKYTDSSIKIVIQIAFVMPSPSLKSFETTSKIKTLPWIKIAFSKQMVEDLVKIRTDCAAGIYLSIHKARKNRLHPGETVEAPTMSKHGVSGKIA